MESDAKPGGPCSCMMPEVAATFSQSAARFNERAAFAGNAAMDDNTMMRMQFAAQAQQQLESGPGDRLAPVLAQLAAVVNGLPHGNVPLRAA